MTKTKKANKASLLAAAVYGAVGASATALGAYNVDPTSVSVSGLSGGAFMAAQLGIAYSGTFQAGFGVFAGGPYDCARNQLYTLCMYNLAPATVVPTANIKLLIDNITNLKSRNIFLWSGTSDTTVGVNVVNQLSAQLTAVGVPSSKMSYVQTSGAAHTFPTDYDSSGNNACSSGTSPYIANCGYDGAGAALKWIYGSLNARNDGTLTGSVVSFAQTGSYVTSGMESTGYMYVPAACADGSTVCKLHVALHGCSQQSGSVGTKFVTNTGFNKWADTNNIIILYPQAAADVTYHFSWDGWLNNPYACWDWVGWYGTNADQKGGLQMTALVNQVNRITSGYTG